MQRPVSASRTGVFDDGRRMVTPAQERFSNLHILQTVTICHGGDVRAAIATEGAVIVRFESFSLLGASLAY